MNQLWLMLGLKAEGFFGGLKRATDESKNLERSWKNLGKAVAAGGVTYAVIGFFQSMIQHARDAKGEIDANTQAVRNLGDGFDFITTKAKDFGVGFLGILGRAGENLVDMANYVRLGSTEFERQAQVLEQSEKGAAAVAANLASAQKHASEFKAATTGLASEEKKRAEIALRSLSTQEQMNVLENRLAALTIDQSNAVGTKLEQRQRELEISQLQTRLQETQVTLDREAEAAAKQSAAARKAAYQAEIEAMDKRTDLQRELNSMAFEALPPAQQLTALERERATLQTQLREFRAAGLDATEIELDLAKNLTEIEARRKTLAEQTAAAKAQELANQERIAEAAAKTQRIYEETMFGLTNGGLQSRQINDAETAALREQQRRNNGRLSQLWSNPGNPFEFGNSLEITRLKNENNRIKRELDLRDTIQRGVAFQGVEGFRRQFQGDPILYDRLVERFTRDQTQADKTNLLLERLSTNLEPTRIIADQLKNLTSATVAVSNRLPASVRP